MFAKSQNLKIILLKSLQKKKGKEKSCSPKELTPELGEPPPAVTLADFSECGPSGTEATKTVTVDSDTNKPESSKTEDVVCNKEDNKELAEVNCAKDQIAESNIVSEDKDRSIPVADLISKDTEETKTATSINTNEANESTTPRVQSHYNELSRKLERMVLPTEVTEHITEEREQELERQDAYLTVQKETELDEQVGEPAEEVGENAMIFVQDAVPSAPCFEEIPQEEGTVHQDERERMPRVKCMPIEDAIRMCGGKEMDEVRQMSETEEALVAAGSLVGPGSALFDLLPTLRYFSTFYIYGCSFYNQLLVLKSMYM